MDLIFNELSILPLADNRDQAFKRVDLLLSTFKRSISFEFNRIRFHTGFDSIGLSHEYSLNDYCSESQNRTKATLLRGLFRYPFIDDNSKEEVLYIQSTFRLRKEDKNIEPFGLAAAYLYSTLGIGFDSEPFWNVCKFELRIIGENKTDIDNVFCTSKPEHFDDYELINWQERKILKTLSYSDAVTKLFSKYLFEDKAIDDLIFWQNDESTKSKIVALFKDVANNPFIGGIGKTESLKGRVDTYSKRIDGGNRLVYKVESGLQIRILSCHGHYDC